MRGSIYSDLISSFSLLLISSSQFYISNLKRRCEHTCILIIICLKGQDRTYVGSFSKPSMCIASFPRARSCASYWIFIILESSHFWMIVMIWLSTALRLYFTHHWLTSHTCSWYHRISNLDTLSWYKWEKWDPKMGCHLDRNSNSLSFFLFLTPPILTD